MRRPAYDSNVAFEGKIKSMRLISEMIGFGPMPAPDREVERKRKNSRRLVRVKCLCQTIRV